MVYKYLITALFLLTVLGAGAKLIYDRFGDLNYEISSLKSINKNLIAKQKTLETKNKENKKKMKKHRKALIAKKLNRAKLKLAKAPVSMIPMAGAAAVIAFTANDIHNYCQDVKEFKKFEASMFGALDNEVSEDEKILCGFDI